MWPHDGPTELGVKVLQEPSRLPGRRGAARQRSTTARPRLVACLRPAPPPAAISATWLPLRVMLVALLHLLHLQVLAFLMTSLSPPIVVPSHLVQGAPTTDSDSRSAWFSKGSGAPC